MDFARRLIREPDVANARQYRRRVGQLAVIYVLVFLLSAVGIGLLLSHGRLFVGLTQRSNVETLTIAFFLVFFAYIGLLSSRGAWGGLQIIALRLWGRLARKPAAVERRKIAKLGGPGRGASVAMNRMLQRADRPGDAFDIAIGDEIAPAGSIRVDGVKVQHRAAHRDGSNDLLAYFVRQVTEVAGIDPDELEVVSWATIDEEGWHQYVGLAESMRALGRRTGDGTPIWPSLTLTPDQCAAVEHRMSEICGAVREEALLPQLEFEGEHKIPIVPEPLGILSLSRREKRVDPLSSIGSSLVIVALVVGLLIWFIVRPPWVPGK
jgi:hypothetical protein